MKTERALGMFTQGNMATWLDRNVYKSALNLSTAWDGKVGTYDLPSLQDMTLKAVDILSTRSKEDGDTGFMLMSEAASIDKQVCARLVSISLPIFALIRSASHPIDARSRF